MEVIKTFSRGNILMAFDQNKYISDFQRQNYDRIVLQIPKGKKQLLKDIAKENQESLNKIVINALEQFYKIDLSK